MSGDLVYIIVLNWNGYENTINCIESLKHITYKNHKILIVDNCSTDGSYDLLKNNYQEYSMIRTSANLGFASGMNAGAKYAILNKAVYIVLANNDLIFDPNFLEPLVRLCESKKNIGMISPKVYYMHNKRLLYCAGGKISKLKCVGVAINQGKIESDFDNSLRKIDFVEGCMIFVKSEVFELVGYMNDKFFMYFEDVEFSLRAKRIYDFYYCPESIVYHKAGAGIKWDAYSPLYHFYYTRNRLWLFCESSLWVKNYVIIYSIFNVCAKLCIIVLKKDKNTVKSIKALFSGLLIGLRLILKSQQK